MPAFSLPDISVERVIHAERLFIADIQIAKDVGRVLPAVNNNVGRSPTYNSLLK
jgi:hypothetical protein